MWRARILTKVTLCGRRLSREFRGAVWQRLWKKWTEPGNAAVHVDNVRFFCVSESLRLCFIGCTVFWTVCYIFASPISFNIYYFSKDRIFVYIHSFFGKPYSTAPTLAQQNSVCSFFKLHVFSSWISQMQICINLIKYFIELLSLKFSLYTYICTVLCC